MTMKRSVGEVEFESVSSMAACLMLLSRGHEYVASLDNNFSSRVFECKTCNRQFLSFQALGGHRASHKKPRTAATVGEGRDDSLSTGQLPLSKPKTHECLVCGQEFSIGQALGGHMRRHRATAMGGLQNSYDNDNTVKLSLSNMERTVNPGGSVQIPVVKKSSSRRVLWLDLNLTPTENDSKLEVVKPTTPIFCYL